MASADFAHILSQVIHSGLHGQYHLIIYVSHQTHSFQGVVRVQVVAIPTRIQPEQTLSPAIFQNGTHSW